MTLPRLLFTNRVLEKGYRVYYANDILLPNLNIRRISLLLFNALAVLLILKFLYIERSSDLIELSFFKSGQSLRLISYLLSLLIGILVLSTFYALWTFTALYRQFSQSLSSVFLCSLSALFLWWSFSLLHSSKWCI